MKNADSNILNQVKKIVTTLEPAAKVYWYGSGARGTAGESSDCDVLILLDKDKVSCEDEQKITYPLYDLEFETGVIISPVVYSEKEWHTRYKVTPFYRNVMRDGKLL